MPHSSTYSLLCSLERSRAYGQIRKMTGKSRCRVEDFTKKSLFILVFCYLQPNSPDPDTLKELLQRLGPPSYVLMLPYRIVLASILARP